MKKSVVVNIIVKIIGIGVRLYHVVQISFCEIEVEVRSIEIKNSVVKKCINVLKRIINAKSGVAKG